MIHLLLSAVVLISCVNSTYAMRPRTFEEVVEEVINEEELCRILEDMRILQTGLREMKEDFQELRNALRQKNKDLKMSRDAPKKGADN